MLDDGRVCWWKRMPTAEMGCGTCDPNEVVSFFLFLPYRDKSERPQREKVRRMGE